jgi:hypothetical protein
MNPTNSSNDNTQINPSPSQQIPDGVNNSSQVQGVSPSSTMGSIDKTQSQDKSTAGFSSQQVQPDSSQQFSGANVSDQSSVTGVNSTPPPTPASNTNMLQGSTNSFPDTSVPSSEVQGVQPATPTPTPGIVYPNTQNTQTPVANNIATDTGEVKEQNANSAVSPGQISGASPQDPPQQPPRPINPSQ